MARQRNENEEPDLNGHELLGSLLDMLFGTTNAFTFLIAIDGDQERTGSNNNLQINTMPIFIARSLFRAVNTENEAPNSAFQSPHFLDFIQNVFNNMKKKELLKKELLKNKPYTYKKTGNKEQECPVCLSCFKPREKIRKLNCEHEFHKRCVDKWLMEGNPCCPLCRKVPFLKDDKK